MARVSGYTEDELIQLEEAYTLQLEQAMNHVMDRFIESLSAVKVVTAAADMPGPEDATRVVQYWQEETGTGALTGYLGEVHTGGAVHVALGVAEAYPDGINPGVAVLPHENTIAYIQQLGQQLDGVGEELWDTVRNEIAAGVEAGEGIPEITQRLRTAAGLNSKTAERVARTQVHAAAEAGSLSQVRFLGYTSADSYKTWVSTHDLRTRPTHVAANEQRVPLDGKFIVGGWSLDHPGDYTAPASEKERCRCTSVFDLDTEPSDEMRCDGTQNWVQDALAAAVGGECAVPGDDQSTLSRLTVPQLRTMARDRGMTGYTGLRKPELVDMLRQDLHDEFVVKVVPKLEAQGAEFARLDQLLENARGGYEGLSTRAIEHTVKVTTNALGLDDAQAAEVRRLLSEGDTDAIDRLAAQFGLTRVTPHAGEYDRWSYDLYKGSGPAGRPIQIVTPGYAYMRQGERFVVTKGVGIESTEADLLAYQARTHIPTPEELEAQAAAAEQAVLSKLTVTQLRAEAKGRGVFLMPGEKKPDILAALKEARGKSRQELFADAVAQADLLINRQPPLTATQLRAAGIERVSVTTGKRTVAFDPSTMDLPTGSRALTPGEQVTISQPGYVLTHNGQTHTLRMAVANDTSAGAFPAGTGPLPNRTVVSLDQILPSGLPRTWGRISHAEEARMRDQFINAINEEYGRLPGNRGGLHARVNSVYLGGDGLRVSGQVIDAQGHSAGTFTRRFARNGRGGIDVEHEYLQLYPNYQGSGFAEQFNRNLFDWYRRSGVKSVLVHADIDVGGYTWAMQGFEFRSKAEAAKFLSWAERKLQDAMMGQQYYNRGNPLPQLTQDEMNALLGYLADLRSGKIKTSAHDIAMYGRQPGQGGSTSFWPGKWLMLGSNWYGRLRL